MKLHLQHNARQAKINGLWERFSAELHARENEAELLMWWESGGIALVASMPPIWQELAEEAYSERFEAVRR